MTPSHLLYLHGFRSSPQSFKARRMAAWLAQHRPDIVWCCPQLPPSPAAAWALMQQLTLGWPRETTAVVGSSLGGFYATVAAEAWGCRALVMNPAVDPARDLARYIGEQTAWHDPAERFYFLPEYVDELRALTPATLTPGHCTSLAQRYSAVIAQGDELLDWREMAARHAGATTLLIPGSDHALSDFDQHLPWVLRQLDLAA